MDDAGDGVHRGLPDIAKNFVDLLTSMLRASDDVVGNVLETEMRPGDIRLWSKGEVEESPEESETPMPVAFGPVLALSLIHISEPTRPY